MAAVWNQSPGAAGKPTRSSEKMERELRRLRFDVKQYDAQLKKLQRELVLRNSELKRLKSCGACTCLGDRRRGQRQGSQTAEVRDLGTFGNTASRKIAERARLDVHERRPATAPDGQRRDESVGAGGRQTPAVSLRRSRTEYFQHGIRDAGADSSATLAEKERELARLHQELAQLRAENSALKEEAAKCTQRSQKQEGENAVTLRELSRQVRELENELLKLREERHRLLAGSERLRDEVSPKETDTRIRDCNPYCEVCRIFRSKLVKHSDSKLGALNGQVRAAVSDDDGQVEQQHQRSLQDKAALRQELTLGLDEQDKQKRLVQQYLNGTQTYDWLLADKDREISKLKGTLFDLERDYKCVRKRLSERDANLQQLQRDLSAVNVMREKTEQGRAAMADDYRRLEQQYQKSLQDKAALQQELTLCVEEQDKQKRLAQRYLDENQTYERLLADKDREISKLKGTIRDLERDYDVFRRNLTEQEANLLRLQRDLSTANAMKEKTEKGRVVLADDYKRLQQQYQKLYQDKAAMQRELELCVEEQDKQKRMLQRYLNEIQSYERLLAEKEKERMDMLLQFQASAERVCKCGNSPPRP